MTKKCDCSRVKQNRYFKQDETELPEEELTRRKRAYFRGQLFYKRLCDLVTQIDEWKAKMSKSALENEKAGLEFNEFEKKSMMEIKKLR